MQIAKTAYRLGHYIKRMGKRGDCGQSKKCFFDYELFRMSAKVKNNYGLWIMNYELFYNFAGKK